MAEYYIWSGSSGANNGSSWEDAFSSLQDALSGVTEADGDIFYIASDYVHYGWPSVPINFTASVSLLSVNRASGQLEAGAIVGTPVNATGNISIDGVRDLYCYGVSFVAGYLPDTENIVVRRILIATLGATGASSHMTFDTCHFAINKSSNNGYFSLGRVADNKHVAKLTFINSTFKFSHASQGIGIGGAKVSLLGCRFDDTGESVTYALLRAGVSTAYPTPEILCSGCDFSHAEALYRAASFANRRSKILFVNCLVPASLSDAVGTPGPDYPEYELHACGTPTDDHAYQYNYQSGLGVINYNTGVYQTSGGATFSDTDGTDVPQSLMMVSSGHVGLHYPLYSPWLNVLIDSAGSKTLSVNIAHELSVALKDNECWIEIEYMGDAANALTSAALSAPTVSGTNSLDVLAAGSNLADTEEAWTGLTTEITHTLSKSVTINQQGFARVRVALAKPSTTVYIDPQATVI